MLPMPSASEVPTPSEESANRRSSRWGLAASFVLSLLLVGGVLLAIALSSTANASQYSLTGSGNWTSSASWSCTGTSAPGSIGCIGGFPGGGGVDGDVANLSSGATVTVTSAVPNAVTLNHVNAGLSLPAGAQLDLIGTSAIGTSGGFFAIAGGTLNNNGTLNFTCCGSSTFSGGTLGGTGTTSIPGGVTLNFTGAVGTMTVLAGQTISNASTISFSSAANALTLNGTLANTGTFSLTGDAPILGTGPINNSGLFQKTGGTGTSPIFPQLNNTGTVSVPISLLTLALNGGGTHSGSFNNGGPGSFLNFNSAHTFNVGSSFPSSTGGGIQIVGGSFNVATPLTISVPLNNGGTIGFGGAAQTLSLSSYTQTGTLAPRLISNGVNDKLVVSGTASIGGTLLPNPTYTPAAGDAFTVLTGTPVSGTMSYTPINYPGRQLQASFSAAAVSLAAAPTADLSITKTVTPLTINTGQNATYTVTVANAPTSSPASNVTVQDNFSGGTLISASPSQGSCIGGGPIICTLGGLANGSSATITVVLQGTAPGTMSNSANVTATEPDPIPGNNAVGPVNVTVNPIADLGIGITDAPDPVNAGANVTYTATVSNAGPDPANTPSVAFTLTGGTVSSVAGGLFLCTNTPTTVSCTFSSVSMSAPSSGTISIVATAGAGATMSLAGNVTSTTTDPNAPNNSATQSTAINATDFAVVKSGPGTATTGSTITYTVDVKNLGPASAAGTIAVSDPTPAGLTLLSVSGGGCSAYPCNVGPLAAGSFVTITNTYQVTATSGSVTNTASVPTGGADPVPGNNTSTVTTTIAPQADLAISKSGPRTPPSSGSITFLIKVTNNGPNDAFNVVVNDPTPSRLTFVANTGDCTTPFPCSFGSIPSGTTKFISARYNPNQTITSVTNTASVSSLTLDPIGSNNTASWTVTNTCPTAPTLVSPLTGTLPSPVTFTWNAVPNADTYTVFAGVNGATPTQIGNPTSDITLTADISNGAVVWYVVASSASCPQGGVSGNGAFNVCTAPGAPQAGVVGAPTSGQPYAVLWDSIANAASYEVQEASNDAFTGAITQSTNAQSVTFTHSTTAGALVFFYRVRAIGTCTGTVGSYSRSVRVVVLPPPANQKYPNFDIPAGTQNTVQLRVFIEGDPAGPQNFTITLDKPWMVSVSPSSGVLPPEGLNVILTVDPSKLPNGTFTGTLLVNLSPLSPNSRLESNANPPRPVPVTVNLVTPIIPSAPTGPTADTIIIPAVGRLTGINSQWRSDVRVFNGSSQALKYQLDFLPSQASESKRTTINTAPGDTTALDDIIHNWYGFGEVGDSASGILQIRPLSTTGVTPPASSLATVVSSRTYNNTASQGTLGQFIPGILFRNFIGRQTDASKPASVLSLQQLAQSPSYRTNVGVIEASGLPATALLSILDKAGSKLTQDFSISLKGGEQVALNQLLAQKGITANDARIEVRVTGGDGKVSAYASVVDNNSLDPLLVSPVLLGQITARTYVLPGVADLNTGSAAWRSDLRILNGGSVPQAIDLLFYPQGNAGNPVAASLTVNPGEVKVLDNVLLSLFSTTNAGGAVHVNTATDSQLVVTGRTFNQTSTGTLGQFIPAATLLDGIDRAGARALNILQVEDSVRYRTNVGLAEMSGNAATVEVSVNLPDSKATPTVQIPLAANEFRQFALRDIGLSNIYNARVSVRVVGGNGKVTAYGSVIDMNTSDPTYVPAQ